MTFGAYGVSFKSQIPLSLAVVSQSQLIYLTRIAIESFMGNPNEIQSPDLRHMIVNP